MNDNRCVCCGQIIPEGSMVCPICEEKQQQNAQIRASNKHSKIEYLSERKIKRMEIVDCIVWDWVVPLMLGGCLIYLFFGKW